MIFFPAGCKQQDTETANLGEVVETPKSETPEQDIPEVVPPEETPSTEEESKETDTVDLPSSY